MIDDAIRTLNENGSAPLISVVLPVYNGEKYLAEAIDSILAQSFTGFELIMIDDGSTDASLRIMREYEQNDARVRVVARENRGLATTLNDSIDIALGEWIARMDQDDIALPQRFERQLQWIKLTNADICGSWVRVFGAANNSILKHPKTDDAIKMELLFGSAFAHPSVMIKTRLVKQLRYDKAWEKCEDYDLWERAAWAGWKMSNVPEVLLLYRQHGEQISTSTYILQQALGQKIRRRYWELIIKSMDINCKWIDEVLKIREPSPTKSNMDVVDLAIAELLKRSEGEARTIIFDHATRLYFRAAATCPDVAARWHKLNKRFGHDFALGTRLKLRFLSAFQLNPDSKIFQIFKRINNYLG